MQKYLTVDVETTGLDWTTDILHGIGIGYSEDEVHYFSAHNIPDLIKSHLEDPSIPKIGHNLHAFDAKFIRKSGINIQGEFNDTMILANLIDDASPLGLKFLADKYLGNSSLFAKQKLDSHIANHKAGNIAGLCAKDLAHPEHPHFEIISKYCKEDVINTTKLFWIFIKKLKEMDKYLKEELNLKKSPLDYYKDEARPLEKVLFEIEYRGIRVDMKVVEKIKQQAITKSTEIETKLTKILCNRIKLLEQELYEEEIKGLVRPEAIAKRKAGEGKCKFSWENNNHVGILFYKYCDLSSEFIHRTEKGKYSTDKNSIQDLAESVKNPKFVGILKLYQDYKIQQKTINTYTGTDKKGIISKIRKVGNEFRIYPEYRQTTGTGRLACKNPNMQNLKRDSEVKQFFIPDAENEVFDDIDYSQIELRTGAHLSQDPKLCSSYIEGIDVHLLTASRLFGREIRREDDLERQAGKRTNFLTIFDGKAFRLQSALKTDIGKDFSIPECKRFIESWFELYPGVRTYLDAQLEFFKKHKFCVSETGRIRRLPDIIYWKCVKWEVQSDATWIPVFHGPDHLRKAILDKILQENPKLKGQNIPNELIGRTAYRMYSHAVKMGYNQPIQSLAASLTKRAMVQLHNEGRVIVNQVHDSLVVSRKKGNTIHKQQVIDIMENIYSLSIPVKVDVKTITSFHPKDVYKE